PVQRDDPPVPGEPDRDGIRLRRQAAVHGRERAGHLASADGGLRHPGAGAEVDAGRRLAVLPSRLAGVPARAVRPVVRAAAGLALVPLLAVIALVMAFAPAGALGQDLQPVPPLAARVTDLTGTLAPAQVQALEGALADIEQRKGAQVAILMVPTTRPEAIEQYGIRVAEAWKLGRGREVAQRATGDPNAPAVDDGVLLLVAKDDRRVRIEVGYGLEGAIPDGIARRIIDESITPRFRREDYFGGLQAAVQDLRM